MKHNTNIFQLNDQNRLKNWYILAGHLGDIYIDHKNIFLLDILQTWRKIHCLQLEIMNLERL